MKVGASVKKMCRNCKVVRRHGVVRIFQHGAKQHSCVLVVVHNEDVKHDPPPKSKVFSV